MMAIATSTSALMSWRRMSPVTASQMIGPPQIIMAIHAGSDEKLADMHRDSASDIPAIASVIMPLWISFLTKSRMRMNSATMPTTAVWPSKVA